jgi:hypothetical protein
MGAATLGTLRQVATDTFHNFAEIKEAMRRFKTHQLSTERELNEVNDLLGAWRAISECQHKTIGHVNSVKSAAQKKFIELAVQKDEILTQFRDGISGLKKYELHQNLWKNPSQK